MSHAIIEIRPHRGGWQSFEGPGVGPFWKGKDAKQNAIDYATQRCKMRRVEIRVLDAAGNIEERIQFDDSGRRVSDG